MCKAKASAGEVKDREASLRKMIAKASEELPSKEELRNCIPKHCFERSVVRSFYYVIQDGIFAAALLYGAWQLPYNAEDMSASTYLAWAAYAFAQGVVLTGWWVIAHECGHGAFSSSKLINDSVGFVLHTILYVPYFSWQYSHKKHHARTNHLLDGETHTPSHRKGFKGLKVVHDWIGEDAFALFQVVLHLLFGWPMYLLVNATGSRRLHPQYGGKRIKGEVLDHFRPNSKLFPKAWRNWVTLSTVGIVLWTVALAAIAPKIGGFRRLALLYVFPYLGVNGWLVLYTWLQHTEEEIPHWGDKDWNWIKGAALGTVDRDYGIFDYFHHNIGSTHVCHHLFSEIPHYNAAEATVALKKKLGKNYNYCSEWWVSSMFRVAKKCHYVDGIEGTQFYKSAKDFGAKKQM